MQQELKPVPIKEDIVTEVLKYFPNFNSLADIIKFNRYIDNDKDIKTYKKYDTSILQIKAEEDFKRDLEAYEQLTKILNQELNTNKEYREYYKIVN